MRLSIIAALLCATAVALPASAQQDIRMKLQEEVRMQHDRARELQTVGQADERMAQELNNLAQQLDDHANRLDQRAREFHTMANAQMFNPRAKEQLMKLAEESEGYARSDRTNVTFRRRLASDLSNSAHGAYDAARELESRAARVQAFLDSMGQQQQPPPQQQQNNPW